MSLFPWLLLPPQSGGVPFLYLSLTPIHTHVCCADREGAGVSASSCVTRLISPQPGRLGPEGSGGGGAGPHSPSDKYVFGAAVLKGHGGRRRRSGGLHCAVLLGPSPGPAWFVCDHLQRDDEIQGNAPLILVWATPPTAMLSGRCCCGHTDIPTLEQAHKPTPAHTQTEAQMDAQRQPPDAQIAGSPEPAPQPFFLTYPSPQCPKHTSTRVQSISQQERFPLTQPTHAHLNTKTPGVQ